MIVCTIPSNNKWIGSYGTAFIKSISRSAMSEHFLIPYEVGIPAILAGLPETLPFNYYNVSFIDVLLPGLAHSVSIQ